MEFFLYYVLYFLGGVGLSHILADASIITPVKLWLTGNDPDEQSPVKWLAWIFKTVGSWHNGWLGTKLVEMLNCYVCNGFWSGLLVGLVAWLYGSSGFFHIFLWGFAISLVSQFVGYVMLFLNKISYDEPEKQEELLNE